MAKLPKWGANTYKKKNQKKKERSPRKIILKKNP